jgi:hypothetical protein
MYQRPTITVVGSVRGLTLETWQSCKYGYGSDNSFPEEEQDPGLGQDESGETKDSCLVS